MPTKKVSLFTGRFFRVSSHFADLTQSKKKVKLSARVLLHFFLCR